MYLSANLTVIGKVVSAYTDASGNPKNAYSLNIIQEQGRVIGSVRVSADQFQSVEENQNYVFKFSSGTGRNGLYLKLLEIQNAK